MGNAGNRDWINTKVFEVEGVGFGVGVGVEEEMVKEIMGGG